MSKAGRKPTQRVHDLKLHIINNPGDRGYDYLAMLFGVNRSTVKLSFKELNIMTGKRPEFCKG